MAKQDTRSTVLEIINSVQQQLGVDPTTTLDANKQTITLLQLLNETMDEISDFGDWQEQYRVIHVCLVCGQTDYSMGVQYPVKNIYEVAYDVRPQALYYETITEINRLQRSGGFGEPRLFSIKGVDDQGNQIISIHPRPTTQAATHDLLCTIFRKPRNLGISNIDTELDFPGDLIRLGLLYRALIE